MNFFQIVSAMFTSGIVLPSIALFLVSSVLLLAGLVLNVWHRAVRLDHLELKPLAWIEKTHPHIPSPRLIVAVVLCSATLAVVGLHTLRGVFPFTDPYQGLNTLSFFLLGAAVGVLAELRWKGAGEYAAGFLAGTAVAFLLLLLQPSVFREPVSGAFLLLVLLCAAFLLALFAIVGQRRGRLFLVAGFGFLFWFLMYLLQL